MENIKYKLLNTTFGALSGLTGIVSLSKCDGKPCASCLGCAGAVGGILLIALIKKIGLFQSCHSRENGNPCLPKRKPGNEGTGFRVKHGMTNKSKYSDGVKKWN